MLSGIFNSHFIIQGGAVQYCILGISIVTVAILVERTWFWTEDIVRTRYGFASLSSSERFDSVSNIVLIYIRISAPLLGILGTIYGIIRAFARLGSSGKVGLEGLAADLSMALYTTAFGLIVALLCIIALAVSEIGERWSHHDVQHEE